MENELTFMIQIKVNSSYRGTVFDAYFDFIIKDDVKFSSYESMPPVFSANENKFKWKADSIEKNTGKILTIVFKEASINSPAFMKEIRSKFQTNEICEPSMKNPRNFLVQDCQKDSQLSVNVQSYSTVDYLIM